MRNPFRYCLLAVILAHTTAAAGQNSVSFEFGVRAGVPLMANVQPRSIQFLNSTETSTFERPLYTVGPTFGAIVHDRISVQFEALYKPVALQSAFSTPTFTSSTSVRGSSWEFPVMVHYLLRHGSVRPYGGVGVVIGEFVSTVGSLRTTDLTTGTETHADFARTSFWGQVPAYIVDAGVEWPVSHFALRSEVRFSRWSNHQPDVAFRDPKQFEILIGLSFRGTTSSVR